MTNQRKIEILEQMLVILDKRIKSFHLCTIMGELYESSKINAEEYESFRNWFLDKRPDINQYVDFHNHSSYLPDSPTYYWWFMGWWNPNERLERQHFLETLINELKE